MDEIDQYLNNFKQSYLGELEDVLDVQKIQRCIEYSQLLSAVGQFKESIIYARAAWRSSTNYREDPIYGSHFYNSGVSFALLLDYFNEADECGRVFEQLDRYNPAGPHLGEYAYFLHRRKRDFDNAEKYYTKALNFYPSHSSIHLKYAGFLRHVRRNIPAAEKEYKLAVETNPTSADALGNYASFLHGVHRKIEEAEDYYLQAVKADDSHANNLCNYGLFLSEEKDNFVEAEKMYRRVLDITPTHANTLYNYAVLLDTHLQRKPEAEQFYRRALEVEPRHAYALYNLAVLLEEKYAGLDVYKEVADESQRLTIMDKRQEVCVFYQRAAEADQKDATTLADYARYIFVRLDNATVAEPMLVAAIKLDPACEVALYHLALLLYKDGKDVDRAEQLLRSLLKVAPQHANGMLTLARLLADEGQKMAAKSAKRDQMLEEAASVYERAIPLSKEPVTLAAEYLRFSANSGSNKIKLVAIKSMGTYTASSPKAATTQGDAITMCRGLIEELKASVK